MTERISSFNETVTKLLEEKLASFKEKKLDLVVCVEVYHEIFNTLADVMSEAEAPVDNEALNYLAQQYYDAVTVNNNQELDPNIFTQRAKLSSIDTKQLALMAVMLNGTDFCIPILHEIRKRS